MHIDIVMADRRQVDADIAHLAAGGREMQIAILRTQRPVIVETRFQAGARSVADCPVTVGGAEGVVVVGKDEMTEFESGEAVQQQIRPHEEAGAADEAGPELELRIVAVRGRPRRRTGDDTGKCLDLIRLQGTGDTRRDIARNGRLDLTTDNEIAEAPVAAGEQVDHRSRDLAGEIALHQG